jgi:hypothetical protein
LHNRAVYVLPTLAAPGFQSPRTVATPMFGRAYTAGILCAGVWKFFVNNYKKLFAKK